MVDTKLKPSQEFTFYTSYILSCIDHQRIRFHTPPKVKGSPAKVAYYHGRSYLRYEKTIEG